MRDHQEQIPHLIQPKILAAAAKSVDVCVHSQAGIRWGDGHDVAGEK